MKQGETLNDVTAFDIVHEQRSRIVPEIFLSPAHASHFCRVEFNLIKCGRNATADSDVFLPN